MRCSTTLQRQTLPRPFTIYGRILNAWSRTASPVKSIIPFIRIVLDGSFSVGNVSVAQGKNGMFVAMPSYKTSNSRYKDVCFPITKEFREKVNKAVLETYKQEKEKAVQKGQERVSQQIREDERGYLQYDGEPLPFR
ncbi:MAG: hypothetical protein HFI21_07510 [Lachnospiraceae bacterium]|nr:hypothetical protein [Lachnospiraceae bacterium]